MLELKKVTRIIGLSSILAFSAGIGTANAVIVVPTLPPPTTVADGIPVAIQYDDFYSYSAGLLDELQANGYLSPSLGDFDFTTGTGLFDLLVYTGASGQVNDVADAPGSPDEIPDPLDAPAGSGVGFDGTWGDGSSSTETYTVAELLSYLNTFEPGLASPVFFFDHNQTGSSPDLYASAIVKIINPDSSVAGEWCFDNTIDMTCDLTDRVLSPGEINLVGTSGTNYDINNNTGSGKPDFLITPIGMDLNAYNPNAIFSVEVSFRDLNNGFEELGIFGLPVQEVPEPSALMLFGAGLLGYGAISRRRRKTA